MFKREVESSINASTGKTLPYEERKDLIASLVKSDSFKTPSRNSIGEIFMYDFKRKEPIYNAYLRKRSPTSISLDHTFFIRYT
jgi:hypothetical protein